MKPASRSAIKPLAALLAAGCAVAVQAQTFSSGSTGADGALSPTVNTEVVLPPSGILNYTTVNIPTGVTVTFRKNTLNTPVVLLVQGDATIVGTININGQPGRAVGSAGDGNQGDDGQPGDGGPGGFTGGRGGSSVQPSTGGAGLGPGGGMGGARCAANSNNGQPGAGAGHNGPGQNGGSNPCSPSIRTATAGPSYGSSLLLPLIGGSGGGGGAGNLNSEGAGGGGGGGAVLVAASGTLNVAGSIVANGAAGGAIAGVDVGFVGGSGSGGAIRLVATTVAGNGTLSAVGANGLFDPRWGALGTGATGRIRIEGNNITRTAASNPADTKDVPGPIFIPNSPSIRIATVAGQTVPATPTGNADVTLPTTQTNPVTVTFESANVPLGNTIRLTVTPANADATSAVSTAISGTLAAGTASVSVTLPQGPSVLQAQTTYTIVAMLGDALRNFANNERVERLEVSASLGGAQADVKLVTVSGKKFDAPPAALALIDTFNAMQVATADRGS